MKVLCVFTNKYPYTTVEPYLESEALYYNKFDKVYIFSLIVKKSEEKERRKTQDNIEVFPIRNDKVGYVIYGFRTLFNHDFKQEIKRLKKESKISVRKIITLLIYISRAHVDSRKICRLIGKKLNNCESIFYTYRFEFQPYTAFLVKQKLHLSNTRIVSRAHGYDLYEERSRGEYIPLRYFLLEQLYQVYPCSKAGEDYLKNKFPLWKDKIITKYLGTNDYGVEEYGYSKEPCIIVSCSNVVKIKRIDRIIDVLSIMRERNIEWVHFGDGPIEKEIKQLAKKQLDGKVKYRFMGRLSNSEILEYYRNNSITLFINLSDSEGLPVSIMEAMSFGIPCIATNVGGTAEIVINGYNGFLIGTGENDQSIANTIDTFISSSQKMQNQFRMNARETWDFNFNANRNYSNFTSELYYLAE